MPSMQCLDAVFLGLVEWKSLAQLSTLLVTPSVMLEGNPPGV